MVVHIFRREATCYGRRRTPRALAIAWVARVFL
jgi:hypothetical protein